MAFPQGCYLFQVHKRIGFVLHLVHLYSLFILSLVASISKNYLFQDCNEPVSTMLTEKGTVLAECDDQSLKSPNFLQRVFASGLLEQRVMEFIVNTFCIPLL